jgi:hypothetical protein
VGFGGSAEADETAVNSIGIKYISSRKQGGHYDFRQRKDSFSEHADAS